MANDAHSAEKGHGVRASVASVATHTYNKLLGEGRVALSQPDMYFSPVPQKTVSILNRPPNGYLGSPSRKNVENYEAQYQKDQAAFEKHAACLRRQADQPWHHDGPSPPSLWERGHIADRGRGRTDVAAAQGLFNPITSEFKIEPKLLEGWKGHGQRPTSAPPGKVPAALSSREDKALQAARGVRDPITGAFKPGFEGSPDYSQRARIEWERQHGYRGPSSWANQDWAFNPITGAFTPLSPAAKAASPPGADFTATARPATAYYPSSPTRSQQQQQPSSPLGHGSAAVDGMAAAGPRPGSAASKRIIQTGESWGVYDPIRHVWSKAPANAKFHEPSAGLDAQCGLTGTHSKKVATPPSQGVYNPILNKWTVPPADPRYISGLSFAPANLFVRVTPATIRSPS
ncbi:hypothetical protein QJQ45_002946 [Haematococcus lacustris]|nr:hypothetical protein QJQ45_002946 [Haematococcus lacustris]